MDDYQHMGLGRVPITIAVNATDELIEYAANGGEGEAPSVPADPSVPSAQQNDQALQELQRMMKGVGI